MNLLQVTPTNVYPPADGGQHRSHGLVSALPELGDTVYRYCQGGHLSNYLSFDLHRTVSVTANYDEFQHLNPVFDVTRMPELFGLPNVFIGHSLKLMKPSRLLDRIDWADVVLVELPWQVPAVTELADDKTPVLYSSHNVEAERFESTGESALDGWFTDRVATIERAALRASDAVVCTSQRDTEEFRRRFDVDFDDVVAPNGVSQESIGNSNQLTPTVDIADKHAIEADTIALFVGTNYGPNHEAANAVLRMAESSLDRGLSVHFLIVGSVGQSIADAPANVSVTGFVPELHPYFDGADIGLNPIVSGSGTNIKLLEYLAHGLPVVTTEFGVRGFDITDGREAVVASLDEFVDAIERVASDQSLRECLTNAGQRYVRRNHRWEQISTDLRRCLVELIDD